MSLMQHTLALAGHGLRLLPLAPPQAEQLFPLIDAELWSGMAARRPECIEDLGQLFAARLEDPAALPFAIAHEDAIAHEETGALIGTTGLYELDPEHGRAEVGGTFFGRPYWGSGLNSASKLLLLGHAFESLGLSRIAFRVDTRNARSVKALVRMGAEYEGTLRAYRATYDGGSGSTPDATSASLRTTNVRTDTRIGPHIGMRVGPRIGMRVDTAVFSVLDHEWGSVRARLLDRLALQKGRAQDGRARDAA